MTAVYIYIYDLSNDFAQKYSFQLIGQHVDGIWHTGIVVFEREIYYGSNGIESCEPEGTVLGHPKIKYEVGSTLKTKDELEIHLYNLSLNVFHGSKYRIFSHNCNTFSNELAKWLTGKSIPEYVIDLPRKLLNTPLISSIQPWIERYQPVISAAYVAASTSVTSIETELTPIFFEEPLCFYASSMLNESSSSLKPNFRNLLIELIDLINNPKIFDKRDDFYGFLCEIVSSPENIDNKSKLVFFDVLRLLVLRDKNILTILSTFLKTLTEHLDYKQEHDELVNMKLKMICNLIGKNECHQITSDTFTLLIKYTINLIKLRANDIAASSIVRNIVVNDYNLGVEEHLEIASPLIYLISESTFFPSDVTYENIIGSIYGLVRKNEEIKGLAKSYEINNKLKKESYFCKKLFKELQ